MVYVSKSQSPIGTNKTTPIFEEDIRNQLFQSPIGTNKTEDEEEDDED